MEDVNPQMQPMTDVKNHTEDILFQGNTIIPKVRKKRRSIKNSTAFQMQVESNTDNDFYDFDRKRIINSLMLHCDLTEEESFEIAKIVELRLMSSGQKTVSSGFIREIVNNILFEKGYNKQLEQYYNIITSLDTIESVLTDHNKENSNTGFSPESINLTLAGNILKSYALRTLHSSNISKAHKIGDIHIHDSDFTGVRPYCSGNSIEYIKKNGIKFPGMQVESSPAKHALSLISHMSCFANYLQGVFSGAIGYDAVNIFMAPFFEGSSNEQIKQMAQHMIFSFSQLSSSRGGQLVFSDFNMYLEIPDHYRNTPVVGPGGKYIDGVTYKDYEKEARSFLFAVLQVLDEGDRNGANFNFPKILLHLSDSKDYSNDALFDYACQINAKRGSVYILFDRGAAQISQCCRLSIKLSEEEIKRTMEHPEETRFSAWQNVTINLPRVAYKSKNETEVFDNLKEVICVAMKAHKEKYDYFCKRLDENNFTKFLNSGLDGKPYLRREEAKFLLGMVGLNEMIQCLTGFQLHESEESFLKGLEIISFMKKVMKEESEKYGLYCILEETPAEGCSQRLATLDLKYYPEQAKQYVRGNLKDESFRYYTNSVHIPYDADIDIFERIVKQSKFSPMVEAGSIIHVWLGEKLPDWRAIKELTLETLKSTKASQIAFSPDFTTCEDCHTTHRGFRDECPNCGSKNTYMITRITGYFSKISGWTKGKIAELRDRKKVEAISVYDPNGENKTYYPEKTKIYFFSKPGCQKCEETKERLKNIDIKYEVVDTSEPKGEALARYYDIDELPAMIKVNGRMVMSRFKRTESMLKWIKENK